MWRFYFGPTNSKETSRSVFSMTDMSATLDSVLRSEAMGNKALRFETQLQKQDLDDERKRRSMTVGIVLTVVVGVVTSGPARKERGPATIGAG